MKFGLRAGGAAAGLLFCVAGQLACAADPIGLAGSIIGPQALSEVRGRLALNLSAGYSNIQANGAAIAIGAGEAVVTAASHSVQTVLRPAAESATATATIADEAFARAAGLLSINQTSGAGNAQANHVAIGMGTDPETLAESQLSAVVSGSTPAGPGAGTRVREASVADTAFSGTRGLVQINQSAGSGNSTANNFALRVLSGANP
ncbi:MAG: hypothetical protein HY778_00670 [Betaproteobacteria bacterium]|nr:hypothetical protein [Betaproteobacteria bacterium]